MRGDGGVILLNSLNILGSWRRLVFFVIVVSLASKVFRSFVLMGRAKLKVTISQKSRKSVV
jgi:hypothetical protein